VKLLVPWGKRKHFSPKECAVMSFSRQTANSKIFRHGKKNTLFLVMVN
jgi:hypothetical protein